VQIHRSLLAVLMWVRTSALGASTIYDVDPDHTHPRFELVHFAGLSNWRGTFKTTRGRVELDMAAKSGIAGQLRNNRSYYS